MVREDLMILILCESAYPKSNKPKAIKVVALTRVSLGPRRSRTKPRGKEANLIEMAPVVKISEKRFCREGQFAEESFLHNS